MYARGVLSISNRVARRSSPASSTRHHPRAAEAEGFQNEIALVAPGGADAVGMSVWDLKEDAETCARSAYSGVLKALEQVVEGTPEVHTYEVSNATFHKIVAHATA